MAIGNGTHKLPVTADTLAAIGKNVGDTVTVHLTERRAKSPLRAGAMECVGPGGCREPESARSDR